MVAQSKDCRYLEQSSETAMSGEAKDKESRHLIDRQGKRCRPTDETESSQLNEPERVVTHISSAVEKSDTGG